MWFIIITATLPGDRGGISMRSNAPRDSNEVNFLQLVPAFVILRRLAFVNPETFAEIALCGDVSGNCVVAVDVNGATASLPPRKLALCAGGSRPV